MKKIIASTLLLISFVSSANEPARNESELAEKRAALFADEKESAEDLMKLQDILHRHLPEDKRNNLSLKRASELIVAVQKSKKGIGPVTRKNVTNYCSQIKADLEKAGILHKFLVESCNQRDQIYAMIDVQDEYGGTAVHEAAYWGYIKDLKVLIEAGANIDAQDKFGETALHIAAYCDQIEILKALIKAGADIKATNNQGRTALHIAALWGYAASLETLINAGADIHAQNKYGLTALDVAKAKNRTDIIAVLEAASNKK